MCCRTARRLEKIDSVLKRRPDAGCRRNHLTWNAAHRRTRGAQRQASGGKNVDGTAGAREFDSFSYDAQTDTTKIIQVERCTALAALLSSPAPRRRQSIFSAPRTAIARNCMDSQTLVFKIAKFFIHS